MSTTWCTWIEQGRDVSASPHALARLAAALQLSRAERAYLFELAGRRDPDQGARPAETLPPAVRACIDAITTPAYVLDRAWSAQCWNASAERLFVGWLDQPDERNLLRFIFLQPSARALIADWEVRARRVAAEFRAASSAYLDDPEIRRLAADLQRESVEFAQFWDQHGVLGREGGERRFNHPTDGALRYDQVTFNLALQPDLKLTMLVDGAPASGRRGGRHPWHQRGDDDGADD